MDCGRSAAPPDERSLCHPAARTNPVASRNTNHSTRHPKPRFIQAKRAFRARRGGDLSSALGSTHPRLRTRNFLRYTQRKGTVVNSLKTIIDAQFPSLHFQYLDSRSTPRLLPVQAAPKSKTSFCLPSPNPLASVSAMPSSSRHSIEPREPIQPAVNPDEVVQYLATLSQPASIREIAHGMGLRHTGRRYLPRVLNKLVKRHQVEEVKGGRYRTAGAKQAKSEKTARTAQKTRERTAAAVPATPSQQRELAAHEESPRTQKPERGRDPNLISGRLIAHRDGYGFLVPDTLDPTCRRRPLHRARWPGRRDERRQSSRPHRAPTR